MIIASAAGAAAQSTFWLRMLGSLPWGALYAFATLLAWLAWRVFPYRAHVVRENLSKAFPELDEAGLRDLMRRYYQGFADVLVEIVKVTTMSSDQLRDRVKTVGAEPVRAVLAKGTPVILLAAHQGNWEWMALAIAAEIGHPVDAAYKPLSDPWAEREMRAIRTRFGSRLVPAQDLLTDIIKGGKTPRAIAMLADQEPRTSEHQHWTRFLNRDSAFYVGPEEIARATRFPCFFVGMRRTSRGRYEMTFTPLPSPRDCPAPGVFTDRYAKLVQDQIHSAPADWPWSHKRWRLRRSLYGRS